MKHIKHFVFFSIMLIGSFQLAYAHGDLHERIVAVTNEIEISPDSSYLYFKRGKLYFQHKDYAEAIEDMHQANELGYNGLQCDLIFAKSKQQLLLYKEALLYLDKIDRETPHHVLALKARAEIYFQQQQYKAAAEQFEKVIKFAIKTTPENYLLAHDSWINCQTIPGDKKATQILDQGIEELGPIYTLLDKYLHYYVAKEDYKNALLIQEKIIESANRKEVAYYDAAQLCGFAKDEAMKKKYLDSSLDAVYQLPPQKQQNKAMKRLKKNIQSELKQLSKK